MAFLGLFGKKKVAPPNAFNTPELSKPTTSIPVTRSLLLDDTYEPSWWRRGADIPSPYPRVVLTNNTSAPISPVIETKVGRVLEGRFSLPEQSTQLMRVLDDPDVTVAQVSQMVTRDPMLVALLLKVVNSAQYGLAQKVASVNRAISLLGFGTLKMIVLAQTSNSLLKNPADRERFKKLWVHGAMTSVCAQGLARNLHITQGEWDIIAEVGTLGLIVNIGKILLRPEESGVLAAQTNMSEWVVEGFAASCFAKSWGLPPRAAQILEYSARSFRSPLEIIPPEVLSSTLLVAFASFVVRSYGFEDGHAADLPSEELLSSLGWVSPAEKQWIDCDLAREMEKVRVAMESSF